MPSYRVKIRHHLSSQSQPYPIHFLYVVVEIDTVAGYIIAKTGKIPDDDEVLTVTKDDGLVLKTVETHASKHF